jgi:hypothetical protein
MSWLFGLDDPRSLAPVPSSLVLIAAVLKMLGLVLRGSSELLKLVYTSITFSYQYICLQRRTINIDSLIIQRRLSAL